MLSSSASGSGNNIPRRPPQSRWGWLGDYFVLTRFSIHHSFLTARFFSFFRNKILHNQNFFCCNLFKINRFYRIQQPLLRLRSEIRRKLSTGSAGNWAWASPDFVFLLFLIRFVLLVLFFLLYFFYFLPDFQSRNSLRLRLFLPLPFGSSPVMSL